MLYFKNAVYCFPHYFGFPFNSASAKIIFFKYIIAHRVPDKITLHFIYGTFHIIEINRNIFIHISLAFSYLPKL